MRGARMANVDAAKHAQANMATPGIAIQILVFMGFSCFFSAYCVNPFTVWNISSAA